MWTCSIRIKSSRLKRLERTSGKILTRWIEQTQPPNGRGRVMRVEHFSASSASQSATGTDSKKVLTLDGYSLTPYDLCRVHAPHEDNVSGTGMSPPPKMPTELEESPRVYVSELAWERVRASRKVVEKKLESEEAVYGVTTGFGALRNVHLDSSQLSKLQVNLIRSHAAGVGDALSVSRVKRLLTVRINIMAKGYSGVREETLRKMLAFLNADCLPLVPERGSVGCSGDLAPSAHMALGLMGEGLMWNPTRKRYEAADKVAAEHGLEPIKLGSKEGLALINGTQLQSSLLAEALVRTRSIAQQADIVAGCTLEALRAVNDAFIPEVHDARGHSGQRESAERIRNMMDTREDPSELNRRSEKNVQDAYSMRCTPQVHGVVHDTTKFCWDLCETELNAAVDNPLILSDDRMVSAGNFHGEYPGKACDYLAIAASELAAISERRIERMLNPTLSGPTVAVEKGGGDKPASKMHRATSIDRRVVGGEHTYSLPAFLMPKGSSGLNSGFMIPHCSAAALVSENKVLCHPSTSDSISTSAAQEDHVSMGPFAAIKLLRVVENVERVLGIELMAACQALDLTAMYSTRKVESVKSCVRERVPFWEEDGVASIGMEHCYKMLKNGKIIEAVKGAGPHTTNTLALDPTPLPPRPVPKSPPSRPLSPSSSKFASSKDEVLSLALYDATLVTMEGSRPGRFGENTACKAGRESMNDVGLKQNHGVAIGSDGVIKFVGPSDDVRAFVSRSGGAEREIDCRGRAVVPGFVDAHTHAVHAGDRSLELAAKLAGESYASVTERGGGIHFTVEQTRGASLRELETSLRQRLDAMMVEGTTTVEIKSGYGLDAETEIKMLKAIHNVSCETPLKIVPTFLGAHAVPRGMDPEEACEAVCGVMTERLARAMSDGEISVHMIDAFCEDGFFTQEQTRRIMEAGSSIGLYGNFHGDELTNQSSGLLAGKCDNVVSVSHLEHVSDESIETMAKHAVVGVALPSTAFLLRLDPPPVRKLIDSKVPVALATDFNPNCPVMSMPLVMNQACVMMNMTMEEALCASTINAAASIASANEVGSIEVGKRGDFVMLSTDVWQHLIYLGMGGIRSTPIGVNLDGQATQEAQGLIDEVVIGGETVVRRGNLVRRTSAGGESAAAVAGGASTTSAFEPSPEYLFLSDGLRPDDEHSLARCPTVPHSPKRPVRPKPQDVRLALRNALRYFPRGMHEELGKEFLNELELYGHIYMYRYRPSKELKAWSSHLLPGKSDQTRSIMHMILNNLDPAVAQFPHELVTYGGTGSVFQNWAQFRLVMQYLSEMTDEQTLVLYSGHPLGLYPSHKDAPRVVVTNGMVVPNYSSMEDYEKYYMLGVSQYGQMTAGSFCYIGPQGIVHGTTITLLGAVRKYLQRESCDHVVFVTAGLGGMSGAQPKAASITGAIGVIAEVNEDALRKRHDQGWLTEWSDDLDDVIASVRKYRERPAVGVSIGYLGNVVDLWERLADEEDLPVHLGSDQTSCHLVYGGGYYPAGISYDEANDLMANDTETFKAKVDESLRRHVAAVNRLVDRGMYFFDYGNSFMLSAGRAGADIFANDDEDTFKYPSYVQDIMGDVFSLGFGPFRWVCTSSVPGDLDVTDALARGVMRKHLKLCEDAANEDPQAAEAQGCFADNLKWIEEASQNKMVVGSQARILYADAKARVDIALEMNDAVADGRLSGPVVISRDHHDVSGVDSPWRETSNITDGSRFCADMAVHNFVGDAFRGATVVALHNGGGTGFGEAINGGFCLVLDGTPDAARRASMMLHWDVFNGVSRRAWDGNANANLTVTSEMARRKDMIVTRIEEADPELLDDLAEAP
eukprot:g1673.t1